MTKPEEKPKSGKVAKKDTSKTPAQKRGKPRNYDLGHGIYRFSRTKMFHKTARYKFLAKTTPPKERTKKSLFKVKPIGGDKNGGTRNVLARKRPRSYPTTNKIRKHPSKKRFSQQTRYIRPSLKPGKVLILLAGRHRGKRVVLLKVLKSGLLLVTGPLKLNGCPLRRIAQNYVITTRAYIRLPADIVPDRIDDSYFRRKVLKKPKGEDVFAAPKQKYSVSDERKTDQLAIDKSVLDTIKKRKDKPVFKKYLTAMFGLKKTQYPHRMKF